MQLLRDSDEDQRIFDIRVKLGVYRVLPPVILVGK